MASKFVVVTGVRDVDRKLRALGLNVQKRVVRQAIRAALKPMAAEVKAQAPRDKGLLRSAVKVRAVKSRKRGKIALEVRISAKTAGLVKTSKAGQRSFYPAIDEFGDSSHPPDPFARRSYEAKKAAVKADAIGRIRRGVEAEAGRS